MGKVLEKETSAGYPCKGVRCLDERKTDRRFPVPVYRRRGCGSGDMFRRRGYAGRRWSENECRGARVHHRGGYFVSPVGEMAQAIGPASDRWVVIDQEG